MEVYITTRKMTPRQNCSLSAELDNNSDDSEAPIRKFCHRPTDKDCRCQSATAN